jgi:HemY protein
LLEGRYGKAQQRALEALAIPGSSGLNAIIGARAAIDVRNFDSAEAMLSRPDAQATSLAVARLMLLAEIALEQGQPQHALDTLRELRREAGMHTAALRLELRCLQAARRWTDIAPLLDQLVRRKVFDSTQAEHVRVTAQSEQLKVLTHDAAGLREYWNRLPDAAKRHPKVARAAAQSFLQLGGDREAVDILTESLEREWNSELAEIYGECRPADATRQLEQAERWLLRHNQDPVLLRVLGTLCQRRQLWGKAQTYFEASLALDDGWRAHLALGEMLGRLNRDDEANAHFVAALKLATGELRRF